MNAAFVGEPGDVRTWPTLDPLAEHAEAVALLADAAGIDDPTAALLGQLDVLFQAKSQYARAARLSRAALHITERSRAENHPDLAVRLNNLTRLLQDTNRLGEAEPLMRRHLVIFLMFQRDTGHPHPHRDTALNNYAVLLQEMGRTEAEIIGALQAAMREAGLDTL